MTYEMKPLSCNSAELKGLSEKLIVSHYENNYSGAVKRLNAITAQLDSLDFTSAPVFVINGLKREELIAHNSMVLHELYFASLGAESQPDGDLRNALIRDFGSVEKCQAQFCSDGEGARRRFRLGIADLLGSRQKARESMGRRPHLLSRWRKSDPRSRYVRAFISHGLRRQGGSLCRCLYEQYQLGERFSSLSKPFTLLRPIILRNCEIGCRHGDERRGFREELEEHCL